MTRPEAPSQGRMLSENGCGDGKNGVMVFKTGENGRNREKPALDSDSSNTNHIWSFSRLFLRPPEMEDEG